jgi:Ca2+-binding RTX toxin-like protein
MSNKLKNPLNKLSQLLRKSPLPVMTCLLITNHSLAVADELPAYLLLSEEQQAAYATGIEKLDDDVAQQNSDVEVDFSLLFDSGSADYASYYDAGAFAATYALGLAGMSSPATYSIYYGVQVFLYVIAEALTRSGSDAAKYFPLTNKYDFKFADIEDFEKPDGNSTAAEAVLYAQQQVFNELIDIAEVGASGTANFGYATYESWKGYALFTGSVMTYINSLDIGEIANCGLLDSLGRGAYCDQGGDREKREPWERHIEYPSRGTREFEYIANTDSDRYYYSGSNDTFVINHALNGNHIQALEKATYFGFDRVDTGFTTDYVIGGEFAQLGEGDDFAANVSVVYGDKSDSGNGVGNDTIWRAHEAYGGQGNDTIIESHLARGQRGDDLLLLNRESWGGSGNDTIVSANNTTPYNALMYGEGGNDKLNGALLRMDLMYGGSGYDFLTDEISCDVTAGGHMDGGSEQDSAAILLRNIQGLDIVLPNNNIPNLETHGEFDFALMSGCDPMLPLVSVNNIENILIEDLRDQDTDDELDFGTLPQAFTYEGSHLDNTVQGSAFNDIIRGANGDDELRGNAGNDIIDGGHGDDYLYGGAGNDILFPGTGSGIVNGNDGIDTVNFSNATSAVDIKLEVTNSIDNLPVGASLLELIQYLVPLGESSSADGTNILKYLENAIGSNYNDSIKGTSSDNLLFGGHGADIIDALAGNDVLIAGGGFDTLSGGTGADVFELSDRNSTVTITDYKFSEGDRIQIDLVAMGLSVNDDITNYIEYEQDNRMVNLLVDNQVFNIAQLQSGNDFQPSQITSNTRSTVEYQGLASSTSMDLILKPAQVNLTHDWITHDISEYKVEQANVFVSAPSRNGDNGGAIRLNNVSNESFDIVFSEWDYLDDKHNNGENYDYLVIDSGRYDVADGTVVEVGNFDIDGVNNWLSIDFEQEFDAEPYVFLTIQTYNGANTITIRVKDISTSGFKAALYEQESLSNTNHAIERVSYLAVLPSDENDGSLITPNTTHSLALYSDYLGTYNRYIGRHRYFLQEEKSLDNETDHEYETVHVLEIGNVSLIQQVTNNENDPVSIRRR